MLPVFRKFVSISEETPTDFLAALDRVEPPAAGAESKLVDVPSGDFLDLEAIRRVGDLPTP